MTLTSVEYINVISTFLYLSNEKFNCTSCKNKYQYRSKEHDIAFRRTKGCFEPLQRAAYVHDDTILFKKCPSTFVDMSLIPIIQMIYAQKPMYDDVFQATAKLVELCTIVDNLRIKQETKEMERHGKRS